ncbi:MAG: YodL domain-containing protein [Acutalibacteraceae bacterium]|nr:YodL domain-containing protein [Acutalibacteraceae bacterium]
MGIKLYGNTIWNSVTANSDKSIIVVEENKLNNMINALESVGMNYCAYTNDGSARIAINDNDVDKFRRLSMEYGRITKSKVSNSEISNIIGNTTYKSIKNKDYHKYDTDLALKIAQELEKQNINFSGRIYGKSTTITIDKNNADIVEEIEDKIKSQRSIFERKGDIYIDNNINIGEVSNTGYINLQMSVADYENIKDFLQEKASYSAVVAENICTLYCAKEDTEILKELIEEAQSSVPTKEVANLFVQFNYTSRNQLDALQPVIQLYMERYEDENFTDRLKDTFEHTSNYSPEQLSVLGKMFIDTFKDLHNLECIFANTSAIDEYKTNIKNENTLNAIVSERGYNQEQAECIRGMLDNDFSRTLIDLLDYTFTPDDMERFVEASKDYRSILEVIADVKNISVDEIDMLLRNEAYFPVIPDKNNSVTQIEPIEPEAKPIEAEIIEPEVPIEADNNSLVDNQKDDYFRIYQLKDGSDYHGIRFQSNEDNKKQGAKLNHEDYNLVYEGKWSDLKGISAEEKLNSLWIAFNEDLPDYFKGHALAMSDVIIVGNEDIQSAYYVDRFGFTDFPEFFKEKELENQVSLSEYLSENNNLGKTLRQQFASDEITDIAYAFGIVDNSWLKEAHPRDTHENVAKREIGYLNRFISLEGVERDIHLSSNDTGVIFSLEDMEYSCSWQEVGESLYSAVLDYTLENMYQEIVAEAHNDKASIKRVENKDNSLENIPMKIHDARKNEFFNEYITFNEQENRYELMADMKNGSKLNEVMLNSFDTANKLVDYLKKNHYVLDGYSINKQVVLGMKSENPITTDLNIEEETIRPTITCEWSEHTAFESGKTYSIFEFDELMEKADREWRENRQKEIDKYGSVSKALEADDVYHQGYAKTKFTLNMPDGSSYTERQDIGDGDGGVIDFLKQYATYKDIVPILLDDIKLDKPDIEETPQAKQIDNPLVSEKTTSKSVDELQVGDSIRLEGEEWTIHKINGDFSAELRNKDETSPRSVQAFFGHWKERIEEMGFEYIEPTQQKIEEKTPDVEPTISLLDNINTDNTANTQKDGIYHGLNIVTQDMILGDRTNLKNPVPKNKRTAEKTSDIEPVISLFDNNINTNNAVSTQKDEPKNSEKSVSNEPIPEHKPSVNNISTATIKQPEEAPDNKNFRIEDNNSVSGAKTKYRNNVNAIRILRTLESENRNATPEEKKALSLYSGWGGLRYAFEGKDEKWQNEFKELKELLTDDEYTSASASTLDSFYTSNEIIDSIYKVLDNLGFNGGDVLEPAMGVGNFFGRLPEKLQDSTNLYGVEKDSLSGRIATKLYPEANIKVDGFEKTNFQDGSFDVAIGNIPFGDFSVNDSRYNAQNLKIHDYFFTKALDKVRDGGVVAFVTSKGTLDKKDSSFRKSLSEKADLLGAIRLPNNAFKTAGTEVTSDIIFLQKRSTPPEKTPDWVNVGVLTEGTSEFTINNYFVKNREMILGEIVEGNKMYGRNDDTMCVPYENKNLSDLLDNAVSHIFGVIPEIKSKPEPLKKIDKEVHVPENLRAESFFMQDKDLYFYGSNEDKNLETVSAKELWGKRYTKNNIERAKAYIELRSVVRELLEAQQTYVSDEKITELQGKLTATYDHFNKTYGLIHNQTNRSLFVNDTSYPLLSSLEEKVDKDKLIKKSDLFTKRTIKPVEVIEHADNAKEALTVSVFQKGNVDLQYMSKLSDIPEDVLVEQLQGEIYPVPELSTDDNIVYQTASEYLSGDIYKKLELAEASAMNNPMYQANCIALEKAKPEPLKAGDIDINLGATWLDIKYYQQFMYEVFQTPNEHRIDKPSRFPWQNKGRKNIEIEYSEHTGRWNITNKSADRSVTATKTYGIPSKNAYQIFENILNLNDPKAYKDKVDEFGNTVFDDRGNTVRVLDIETTKILQQKSSLIRREFKEWIFRDPQRRNDIVEKYNKEFNCIKPREYDGSGMTFPEMNANIKLHDHQKNAIAHAIFGGNTLFAHSVGAGKTFEMIATAMESKRLGFCNKSMFVVPNHLTEQVGSDFLKLYPKANILVATKKDFTKSNRQKFMSKIATGSYDAVIIGHSQITKLPISPQRQKEIYKEQIRDIINGISELKEQNGSSFLVKAMERTKKSLEDKLNKLEAKNKDNTVYFEELGIDKLFVDEAHEFKNLMSVTKLQNVSGISSRASQRATELFMKCRYLDEKTGGKGVVFATGTPISNSVTELHTMMRYLQYDFLASHNNMQNFDNWVSTFGKQKTEYELAPTGNKFKERTRIAEYANMPELISMFKQVADIKTSDTLKLNVPECELHIINVEPTELQQDLVEELSMRADDVNTGAVDPSVDNMLKITGDGRKVGLDPRLIDPDLEDNPNTKLNKCVSNVLHYYKETADEKLTQIIFCDLGVPKSRSIKETTEQDVEEKSMAEIDAIEDSGAFCVYDDIKEKLIAQGVSPKEIAFIHDANNEQQKAELFAKVRSGEVRVLIGSTGKMGTGTNVQDRIIALHDLDVPWRPSDLEQRRGRMVRQGNINKNVHLFRYVTKGTFDAYSYQILEKKQKFISQIMTSKAPARKCSDVDQEALTYSEIKALCTGDERIKEKLTLENRVAELSLYRTEYFNTKYELEDKVTAYPDKREQLCNRITNIKADIEKSKQILLDDENMPIFKATIGGTEYTDRKEATQALFSAVNSAKNPNNKGKTLSIGDVYGFPIELKNEGYFLDDIKATIVGAERYTVTFTDSASSNLKKLEKAISQFENHLFRQTSELNKLDIDYESAKEMLAKPFEFEDELNTKSKRLTLITDELNTEAMSKLNSEEPKKRTHLFGKKTILSERKNDPPEKENKSKSKDDKSI